MSTWLIVGAARGIAFEYVQQLSSDSSKTVIAIIRSQSTAGPLNELAAERKNVHVLLTDLSSPSKLQSTAEEIAGITGGGLDVLVFSAFLPGTENFMLPVSGFTGKEEALEREIIDPIKVNVISLVSTINTFLPLIRKGSARKLVYITSGMGDIDVVRICEIPNLLGYATSKAAGNIIMAKYAAELKSEGVKTLSLSPGWVDTETAKTATGSPGSEAFEYQVKTFQKIQPDVKGPITPEESVKLQLDVIDKLDASRSGMLLSHHGNDTWF